MRRGKSSIALVRQHWLKIWAGLCLFLILLNQYSIFSNTGLTPLTLSTSVQTGGHRSVITFDHDARPDLKIYVYEMPEYFDIDQLMESREKNHGKCVCCNIFYASEMLLHKHILQAGFVTEDPEQADFFLVPAYVACLIKNGARVEVYPNLIETERFLGEALSIVKRLPYWQRRGGQDHLWSLTQGFAANLFGKHAQEVARSVFLVTNGQYSEPLYSMWKDVVVPGKHRVDPWMQSMEEAIARRQADIGKRVSDAEILALFGERPTKVFWVGNIHKDTMYSRGVRHYVYERFRNEPGWHVETSPGKWINIFPLMEQATFCLCMEGWWGWTPRPYESVLSGCIPVLISDDLVYPFERFIDYSTFSVKVSPSRIERLPEIIDSISQDTIQTLRLGLHRHWRAFHFPDDYAPGFAADYVMHELALKKRQLADSIGPLGRRFEAEWNHALVDAPRPFGTYEKLSTSEYLKDRVDSLLCHPTDPRKMPALKQQTRTHCYAGLPELDLVAVPPSELHLNDPEATVDRRLLQCTQPQNYGAVLPDGEDSLLYEHPIGRFFRIYPDAIVSRGGAALRQSPGEGGEQVTIASQASVNRIYEHLEKLSVVWQGPISLAVLINDRDERDALVALAKKESIAKHVDFHVVERSGHVVSDTDVFYPINVLRNVALQHVRTEWVMMLDIDVVPNACMSMYSGWITVIDQIVRSSASESDDVECPELRVYIPPALELDPTRDPPPPPIPGRCEYLSKEFAVSSLESGYLRPMHMYYPPAYMPTNHSRWMVAKEAFEVEYSVRFEPYYIARRNVMLFNDSFVNRGGNYAQQVYGLHAGGYRFYVLPGLFVVDTPHPRSSQTPWFSRSLEQWDEYAAYVSDQFGVPVIPGKGAEYNLLKAKLQKEVAKFPEASYEFLGADERNVEKFTLVTQTYNRTTLLLQMLEYYCDMPSLANIVVVWNNIGQPIPRGPIRCDKPIVFKPQGKNSLSNRYRPANLDEKSEQCVFMIDDDMIYSHDAVEFAFRFWREHQERLVGFIPRAATMNATTGLWEYGVIPEVKEQQAYSFILTGASLFHRKYMDLYWTLPRAALDFVEEVFNCEDILLNYLISMRSGLGPIWVDAPYQRTSTSGLFQKGAHFDKRSACINKYEQLFGKSALKRGEYMVTGVYRRFARPELNFRHD